MTNDGAGMNGTVDGVFHAVVSVSHMPEAIRFYRDLLGLTVTFDDYHDPAAISRLFGYADPRLHAVIVACPDGSEIELVEFEQPRSTAPTRRRPADAGLLSINLRVRGLAAIVDRLRAAGYPPSSDLVEQVLPDGGTIGVAVCRAPDDVVLILVELPEGRGSLAAPPARGESGESHG